MDTLSTVYRLLGSSLAIAPAVLFSIPVVLSSGWVAHAQAQDINGIFFPRSSDEFFRAGVERLEREIRMMQEVNAEAGDRPPILDIDDSVSSQQNQLERENPWLMDEDGDAPRPDSSHSHNLSVHLI